MAVEHPLTTVVELNHNEANDVQALQLMRHPSFAPRVEGWQYMDIRSEQKFFATAQMETRAPQ